METQKDLDMTFMERHTKRRITMSDKIKRHQQKQFRRDLGAPGGYRYSIVEDAFAFAGKDISETRQKCYLREL